MGSLVFRDRTDAMTRAPLDYPPEALAAKSRELAAAFGYTRKPADSVVWLSDRSRLLTLLKSLPGPKPWDVWLAAEPPVMSEYREALEPLVALPFGEVSHDNPAPNKPGMVQVRLNANGHLRDFSAEPYASAEAAAAPATPESVFHAMGFDMTGFAEITPAEAPSTASDQVRAWKGVHPKIANLPLTIGMATWKGRLTWARVIFPSKDKPESSLRKLIEAYPLLIIAAGLVVAGVLARRNWKLGRVDRNGALCVGSASFLFLLTGWFGDVHAVPTAQMAVMVYYAAGNWLLYGALVALVYLALEPAVRARWPHSLMTWNRLLAGRWRDPQVASHVLIGGAIGCAVWLGFKMIDFWTNAGNTVSFMGNLSFTLGPRQWVGGYAYIIANAVRVGLFGFLMICGLRALVRNVLLAAVVASILFTFTEDSVVNAAQWQMRAAIYLLVYFIIAFVLLRFGLIATMAVIFFANGIGSTNLGLDWKTWYAPSGLASLALLLSVALFAFWKSLGIETTETG
jgi:serine/threonine-protein kinase